MNWRTCNRVFVGTFVGVLAALYVFILLVDPYGVVPFSLPFERPIMSNQRQVYPQIPRTGRYHSVVVGTSTSRLLDPAALSRALGGHFASLACPRRRRGSRRRSSTISGARLGPRGPWWSARSPMVRARQPGGADQEIALGRERAFLQSL